MGLITNDVVRWGILLSWFVACVISWTVTFVNYNNDKQYYYTRYLMGTGLPVARASALTLNLNSMLILFPVCRNLISFLRGSCETREFYKKTVRRQLDKNVTFHRIVAYAIAMLVLVHIVAHCFNMQNLYWAKQDTNPTLESKLSVPTSGDKWVNPITSIGTSSLGFGLLEKVLGTLAGWTGAVLTLTFLLMISASTELMRRSYFEQFWYSHHLFILYYAMLLVHGSGGLVRKQSNLDVHDPDKCADEYDVWGEIPECPVPTFAGSDAASWKWCVFPLGLYFLERLLRLLRSFQSVVITKVINHPSKVIELQMSKPPRFKAQPGQYVFIKCPSLSKLQWHPFTLTSEPEDEYFSVHVRLVGDWTNGLAEAVGANKNEPLPASQLPRISVDGPFGTSSTDIFGYKVAICVAAGIGVTPFASVMKSIRYKLYNQDEGLLLEKVYFFWVCSDTQCFEWFKTQLSDLEQSLNEMGRHDFLEYAICLTRGWSLSQAKNIYLQEERELDAVTGLMQKTHYGRPNWATNFAKIAEENQGERIGVFFCGPPSLSKILHKCCNDYSNRENKTIFVYNKENF